MVDSKTVVELFFAAVSTIALVVVAI